MTEDSFMENTTAYLCEYCSNRWYYDRARCPECNGDSSKTYELDTGTLLATTTAHITPPTVRDENVLGLAEFNNSVTVIAQIATTEHDLPDVGDTVTFTGDYHLRDSVTGPRLQPLERPQSESHNDQNQSQTQQT